MLMYMQARFLCDIHGFLVEYRMCGVIRMVVNEVIRELQECLLQCREVYLQVDTLRGLPLT